MLFGYQSYRVWTVVTKGRPHVEFCCTLGLNMDIRFGNQYLKADI